MTIEGLTALRYESGNTADPTKLTELARLLTNANSGGVAKSLVVKTSPGLVFGFTVSSVGAQFVQLFDLAALPANATVPMLSFQVAATSSIANVWVPPRSFRNGLVIAASSTQHALTLAAAADTIFDVQFL